MKRTIGINSFLGKAGFLFVLSFFFLQSIFSQELYFPAKGSEDWEKAALSNLNWDNEQLAELLAWLPTQGTRSFMVLKDGKIVIEEYWGSKLTGMGEMDQKSMWYWSDASKTLTAAMVGLAVDRKYLKINERVSKYLGAGWTSLPASREKQIKIYHLLSMSAGLDERTDTPADTEPSKLKFFAKAGDRWADHEAVYLLLIRVLEQATGQSIETFYKEEFAPVIGMNGFWQTTGGALDFFSDARSMARLGLFLLAAHNGTTEVIDPKYVEAMTSSSQSDNPAFGLLTWVNSSAGYKLPGKQVKEDGKLIASAPEGMFMAAGQNGQLLMILPSAGLVILRQGTSAGESDLPWTLTRALWQRLDLVFPDFN